jgi:2-phospho-L-lactate guanylyltransferase
VTIRWTVLVPLKALPSAKSRLAESLSVQEHLELVQAIRSDTLAAARAAHGVARVVVVADEPGSFDADLVLVQTVPGMNGGLGEAASIAAERWPQDGVAALVGDLPALQPGYLADALVIAAAHPRSFVCDASTTGTTLLAATPGTPLAPAFGVNSAARHAAIATPLPAAEGLRADVDTTAELEIARQVGVGPATTLVLASWRARRS